MVFTHQFSFDSDGNWFSINITEQVKEFVTQSHIKDGMALIFFQHTTGSVLLIEHEAGVLVDLQDTMERLVPRGENWAHHMRGYDLNGAAHVRTAMMAPSIVLPVVEGELALGEFQDIIVVDMQPERKPRSVLIQVLGD